MAFFNAKSIGELLNDYIRKNPLGEALAAEEIRKNSQLVFGSVLAGRITVLKLQAGILYLKTENSTFRHEAENSKSGIIKRANLFSGNFEIKDIKFKQ